MLWTRLAPQPLAADGGMPAQPYPVRFEVAEDEGFRRIVRRGVALARPDTWDGYRMVPTVMQRGVPASTVATFVVENGKPGAVRAV